jgi:purine-nucleoside phosphorylase
MPVRLSPLGDPAEFTILVGDPRRAFVLGQVLTVQPELSHLARGLWGYGGETERGLRLTVQSTGVGGPSAAAVISDLAGCGVRTAVRLGTCVALDPGIEPGEAFLVSSAVGRDGASGSLGVDAGDAVVPDPGLFGTLEGVAPPAVVVSHDLVRRLDPRSGTSANGSEAPLRDLQTAATLAAGRTLGVASAAVLIVAEAEDETRSPDAYLEERFSEIAMKVMHSVEDSMVNSGDSGDSGDDPAPKP